MLQRFRNLVTRLKGDLGLAALLASEAGWFPVDEITDFETWSKMARFLDHGKLQDIARRKSAKYASTCEDKLWLAENGGFVFGREIDPQCKKSTNFCRAALADAAKLATTDKQWYRCLYCVDWHRNVQKLNPKDNALRLKAINSILDISEDFDCIEDTLKHIREDERELYKKACSRLVNLGTFKNWRAFNDYDTGPVGRDHGARRLRTARMACLARGAQQLREAYYQSTSDHRDMDITERLLIRASKSHFTLSQWQEIVNRWPNSDPLAQIAWAKVKELVADI